ncbi:excinuclease ABC subunit UvrA [Paenibacillus sp. GYB003]|uniref:excinuclease ABC subunit UvrA n=1 Tax=Paenibacillus sp. GYB003 TaxID=2994392 RepID=UPI002F96B270
MTDEYIEIFGAREHNLQNVTIRIPKRKLVVLTGLSGSGKSTLAMDTLQKECQRQYMESMGMVTDFIGKPKVDRIIGLSPSISVGQHVTNRNPRSTVGTVTEIFTYLRVLYARLGVRPCPSCGEPVRPSFETGPLSVGADDEESDEAEPQRRTERCPKCRTELVPLKMAHFSFNKPEGACEACTGLGATTTVDIGLAIDEEKSVAEGGVTFWDGFFIDYYVTVLQAAGTHYGFAFDPNEPIKRYGEPQRDLLLYGAGSERFRRHFPDKKPPKSVGAGNFEGVVTYLLRRYEEKDGDIGSSKKLEPYFIRRTCERCGGARLREQSRRVAIEGRSIVDVASLSMRPLLEWLEGLRDRLPDESRLVLMPIVDDLAERIRRLIGVGLDYLSLERQANTLSGGEAQRLRLASLLGSGLTGVLYVLDEPTAGLHARDTARLIGMLKQLRDLGNTVLVIEHDPDVMRAADHLIDIGPGSGRNGGRVVGAGTAELLKACPDSATGRYLRESELRPPVRERRKGNGNALTVVEASARHLKNATVSFPLGCLIAVTGVSGSGKSTLVFDVLEAEGRLHFGGGGAPGRHGRVEGLRHIDGIVAVDQSPIGKMSRSNIATYTDLFTPIRALFASLPEARSKRLASKHFSFNTPGGRCETCQGLGTLQLDMHFLPDVEVRCPDCRGRRFKDDVLNVRYNGFNITDLLNRTAGENVAVFEREEGDIADRLKLLCEVGLDYVRLGQPTTTLSGGEAQRLKLAKELGKKGNGHTLYLMDEPTAGLHPMDVRQLVDLLHRLVDAGHTVIAIEHNLDLIRAADWIVDLGPEGGEAGGRVMAAGTPEDVALVAESHTGAFLNR